MKNIFENAKFGDKFVTEDGDIAIFFKHRGENSNFLLLEHSGGICYDYDDNGVIKKQRRNDLWKEKCFIYKTGGYISFI